MVAGVSPPEGFASWLRVLRVGFLLSVGVPRSWRWRVVLVALAVAEWVCSAPSVSASSPAIGFLRFGRRCGPRRGALSSSCRAFTAVLPRDSRCVVAADCSLVSSGVSFVRGVGTHSLHRAVCAGLSQRESTSSPGVSKTAPLPYFREWCVRLPGAGCSHAARSSALAVSTTSAALTPLPVERCCHPSRRLWDSCRFCSAALLPLCFPDMPRPSEGFPPRQRLSPHPSASMLASGSR